jgi:hypothetical protein
MVAASENINIHLELSKCLLFFFCVDVYYCMYVCNLWNHALILINKSLRINFEKSLIFCRMQYYRATGYVLLSK